MAVAPSENAHPYSESGSSIPGGRWRTCSTHVSLTVIVPADVAPTPPTTPITWLPATSRVAPLSTRAPHPLLVPASNSTSSMRARSRRACAPAPVTSTPWLGTRSMDTRVKRAPAPGPTRMPASSRLLAPSTPRIRTSVPVSVPPSTLIPTPTAPSITTPSSVAVPTVWRTATPVVETTRTRARRAIGPLNVTAGPGAEIVTASGQAPLSSTPDGMTTASVYVPAATASTVPERLTASPSVNVPNGEVRLPSPPLAPARM